MKRLLVLLVAATLMTGCSSMPSFLASPTPTPTRTLVPSPTSTSTPTATATPTILPPDPPAAGTSNVYGRVIWQEQPLKGFEMILSGFSNELEWYSETSITGDDGRFIFQDVPAGEDYKLYIILQDTRLAGTASGLDVTVAVPVDANLNVGEYYLFATDLNLLSPPRDGQFPQAPSTLRWEAYPGAAYYHLELKQSYATYSDMQLDTTETQVDLDSHLLACTYGWDVTAYSEDGIPLARSDVYSLDKPDDFDQKYDGVFKVVNDDLPSCVITILSPPRGAEFRNGDSIQIDWEPNPLAVKYSVWITKTTGSFTDGTWQRDIDFFRGDFMVQDDGSLSGPALPYFGRGDYRIRVQAYDEDGNLVAENLSGFPSWVFSVK
jgi:hypothetical protein